MTNEQLAILLDLQADKLQKISDGIAERLPADLSETRKVSPLFKGLVKSETYEVYPILDELNNYVKQLREEARELKNAVKNDAQTA